MSESQPVDAAASHDPEGLSVASGVGLVVANMIGAGVLLSTGFMAGAFGPGAILGAWGLGAGLAGLGATAYAWLASVSGRSGGEYRYLSDYLHPLLGYLSGWGSLVIGFAAPVAVDALAVGAFLNAVWPSVPVLPVAVASVVGVTAMHAANLERSQRGQDLLVAVKVGLLLVLVGTAIALGHVGWPAWAPPEPATGAGNFLLQQYWIAFAFSGWNAAIYVAGEFRDPRRDVPRATWIGWAAVSALYLLLNWLFVANLTPDAASVVSRYDDEHVTLAHSLLGQLVGPSGATFASLMIAVTFLSAMSAMTLVGPRVYAEMAEDGFLPGALRARHGRPPTGAVLLQGAIALLFVLTHGLREAIQSTSGILMLFTGLTVLAVFRARVRPPWHVALSAVAYAGFMGWLLYLGLTTFGHLRWELGVVVALATASYAAARRRRG